MLIPAARGNGVPLDPKRLSVQLAKELGKVTLGGLGRSRLERSAKRGHDPGVRRCGVHLDDPSVHGIQARHCNVFSLQLHRHCKRPKPRGSFLAMRVIQLKACR